MRLQFRQTLAILLASTAAIKRTATISSGPNPSLAHPKQMAAAVITTNNVRRLNWNQRRLEAGIMGN